MKKLKGVMILVGCVLLIGGCGANATNEQIEYKQEMTILNDELVSTTEKLDSLESQSTVESVQDTNVEEGAQDKESIEIAVDSEENITFVESSVSEIEDNSIYSDGMVSREDLAIMVGDTLVCTGDDINILLESLGTPDDFVQARSCLYDGDDKLYTYGGIIIYTYPNGAEDIVYLIEVSGDEKLLSGIGVGSTWTDMIAMYGEEYALFGSMVSYELSESASISFQMEDNVISFVEIYNE